MKQHETEWIERTLEARRQAIEPFAAYLGGGKSRISDVVETMLVVVKGQAGEAERAGGAPFSGKDGRALTQAFERLGWGGDTWCGVLLEPHGRIESDSIDSGSIQPKPLGGASLRFLLETLDPAVIVALDETARKTLSDLYLSYGDSGVWHPGTIHDSSSCLLISVDGFESALDSEVSKQRVWKQLKQASYADVYKRLV